jgi:radical SAM family uncharacterized protein
MSDFIDVFIIGDGEEMIDEFLDACREAKGAAKQQLLVRLSSIPGVYVPSVYDVEYYPDGRVKSVSPTLPEAPARINRRIINKLPPPPVKPVVPYVEVVHDRGDVEVQRGCSRGCRFCQAGIIYRPVRERPADEVVDAAAELIAGTGYDEISLVSLNTSDYTGIDELVKRLVKAHPNMALSLPSLRLDVHSVDLVELLPTRRRTGLTFAPEAGSERLRQSINKVLTEESLLKTAATAFERGWTNLKLYFMIGLPSETDEDIEGIVELVQKVRATGKSASGRRPMLRVSVATFVPKPHTPFQWAAQLDEVSLNERHAILQQGLRHKSIRFSWTDPRTSRLEAALSRGDRRTGKAIYNAWRSGCRFDAWSEHLRYDAWQQAFSDAGLEMGFYVGRERALDEVLPWSHIDIGVTTEFLKEECRRAAEGTTTPDCRNSKCNACGLENLDICAKKR